MAERKRLDHNEQTGVFGLLAAASLCIGAEEDHLKDRLEKDPKLRGRVRQAKTLALNAAIDLINTAPAEQVDHMTRQINRIRHRVYIGSDSKPFSDKDDGRWFSLKEQNIIASAIAEICVMCPYDDKKQQRNCKYGRLLNCLNADPDNAGGCGWFTYLGSR